MIRSCASRSAASASGAAASSACRNLFGRDREPNLGEVDAVELFRIGDERPVAVGNDIGDDLLNGLIDIDRRLALRRQQGGKGRPKSGLRVSSRCGIDLVLSTGILCLAMRRPHGNRARS